jgi:hypothetical protein
MGAKDSSKTRVQPVMNALLNGWPDGEPWLGELWNLAALTRPGTALPRPARIGALLATETPHADQRLEKVFERVVPPPVDFLRWLLANPSRMQVSDKSSFGASSPAAREWRRKLFSGDRSLVEQAQLEGTLQLEQCGPQGSGQQWWAFEGFSHVDCCLMTETTVVFIEGKRTEAVSPSTRWFKQRSQLWRNVEAAEQFAAGKEFGVFLAVENEGDGRSALAAADCSLDASFPHLSSGHRQRLSRHLLGFVTWPEVVTKFGLPADCLIDRLA